VLTLLGREQAPTGCAEGREIQEAVVAVPNPSLGRWVSVPVVSRFSLRTVLTVVRIPGLTLRNLGYAPLSTCRTADMLGKLRFTRT